VHIPDGFISPVTYIPMWGVAGLLWYRSYKKITLDSDQIPFLASLSALSFIMMMIAIPLPAGTSAHLSGVALMALLFSPALSFGAISLVLVIEALFFGEGGVTTLGINVVAIAFFGSYGAYYGYRWLRRFGEYFAIFAAGWLGLVLPALFIAVVLGLQPLIASYSGTPLFFPFSIKTTTVALLLPHVLLGIAEGVVTLLIYRFLKTNFKTVFDDK